MKKELRLLFFANFFEMQNEIERLVDNTPDDAELGALVRNLVNSTRVKEYITVEEKIGRIVELELQITSAIIRGHRPSADDEFQPMRVEVANLRQDLGYVKKQYT